MNEAGKIDVKGAVLRATLQIHICFVVMIGFYGAVWAPAESATEGFINETAPVGILVILSWFAVRLVRTHPLLIWTPLPWFLIACATYYGLGPMIYQYGADATIELCDYYYAVSETELVRTHFLNLVGIACAAGGIHLGIRLFSRDGFASAAAAERWTAPSLSHLRRLAVFFLGVGVPLKYLVILPYEFGMLGFVLPGSVSSLQYFSSFAMSLLMLLVHQGEVKWRPVLYVLIASEFVTALLVFSKMAVMVFFVMFLLGRVLSERRLRSILIGSALIALSFATVAPLVSYGRASLQAMTGTHYQAGLGTRLEVLQTYLSSEGEASQYAPSQFGWARLNYANAQAFAMGAFDSGEAGETFQLVVHTLTPRVLWPDKPIMTIGREFNFQVNGNDNSSSAPGLFGESYWNGGWLLTGLAAAFVGLILALFANYAMWAIGSNRLLFLPIVFAGIKMGFRPDDWFVPTYVGAPITALCLHFLLSGVAVFLGMPADIRGRPGTRQLVTS